MRTVRAQVERSAAPSFHFAIRWSRKLHSVAEGWARTRAFVDYAGLQTELRARIMG
jgi:hypothetical protein